MERIIVELEVLLFDISEKRFGIRSTQVLEVMRAVALSQIPQAPNGLEGVLNLRGQVVPVLDVRQSLGLNAKPLHHTDHMLVLQCGPNVVAVRVDRAIDLTRLTTDDEVSKIDGSQLIELVAKTSDGLVDIINPVHLLSAEVTRVLVHAAATEMK